jgi:hypothetical protein
MRIMLTDRSETSARVADSLRHEGHEVLDLCLPDPASPLTCRGLIEHDCPLQAGADLALTAVEHPQEAPSAGTVCARRAAIPVVALGRHDLAHPDLGAALARVAELGDDHVTASVQAAMSAACEQLGIDGGEVVVHHDAGTERITATVTGPIDTTTTSRLAVRLLDAATASGRGGQRRDVAVQVR